MAATGQNRWGGSGLFLQRIEDQPQLLRLGRPAYYGIDCTYLCGSPTFATNELQEPFLPGLVAVSVNNLTGAGMEGDQYYRPLLAAKPVAVIGYSIRVYRVERPWW